MATAFHIFPKQMLHSGPVHLNPRKDVLLVNDATNAFKDGRPIHGTLACDGASEGAVIIAVLATQFGRENTIGACDAHVPGSAHGHDAYTEEAGIVPNHTLLSEELIQDWINIGERHILQPYAQFSLRQLLVDARLTKMFTGAYQTVWQAHAPIGSWETLFIDPINPSQFCNIFYKGTHPVHDSHSCIKDAVGHSVGVIECLAARSELIRNVCFVGNTLEVCDYLSMMHLREFGIDVYCVLDATSYLSFFDEQERLARIATLLRRDVKFVHSSQLVFG